MEFSEPTRLKDTLFNLDSHSGASTEYASGVVVGVVGVCMALGQTYNEAIDVVAWGMPDGGRLCAPPSWKGDLCRQLEFRNKTWATDPIPTSTKDHEPVDAVEYKVLHVKLTWRHDQGSESAAYQQLEKQLNGAALSGWRLDRPIQTVVQESGDKGFKDDITLVAVLTRKPQPAS